MLNGDALVKKARKLNPYIATLESERPEFWSASIASELFRIGLDEISNQWNSLNRGITFKKSFDIPDSRFLKWLRLKVTDADILTQVAVNIFNNDLNNAWNDKNDEIRIYKCAEVVVSIEKTCKEMLKWEESIKFACCSMEYLLVKSCLIGLLGKNLDQILNIHTILAPNESNFMLGENGVSWEISPVNFSRPESWYDMVSDLAREAAFKVELKLN